MRSSARLRLASLVTSVPIVSNVQELDAGPRRFLFFIVFNVVGWQCVAGSVLALFALKIKMPPSWIGFLISFMPFTMVLAVGAGPLLTRFGSKRVMFGAWLLRNLLACTVFAMPWAVVRWGPRAAWYVLLVATLGFCLMRSVGVGGWFPWLHELVPERQRGAYFSAEASVGQLLNIGLALMVLLSLLPAKDFAAVTVACVPLDGNGRVVTNPLAPA